MFNKICMYRVGVNVLHLVVEFYEYMVLLRFWTILGPKQQQNDIFVILGPQK